MNQQAVKKNIQALIPCNSTFEQTKYHYMKKYCFILIAATCAFSCVSKKQLLDAQIGNRYLQNDSAAMARKIAEQDATIKQLNSQYATQTEYMNQQQKQMKADCDTKETNYKQQIDKLNKDLLSQNQKAKELQDLIDAQKRKAEELKAKMNNALQGFSDTDLTVTQKNGKVYVSLSENLLFPSGSATVNAQGRDALLKLSQVLNLNPDINVEIEGHTDSIPITKKFEDNWALSLARSASIVRILVNDYKVSPQRVIASGHSQYDPVDTNSTPEGRARNRRTEIILSPKLDELFKLLE